MAVHRAFQRPAPRDEASTEAEPPRGNLSDRRTDSDEDRLAAPPRTRERPKEPEEEPLVSTAATVVW